jgi:hypothetical protein
MRARLGRYALVSTLVVLFLASTSPAMAGGAWIEGKRAYGVGDPATFRGSFSMSGSLEGRLSDGPYVAYLAPVRIYDVDHPDALRLGEISMVRSDRWGMIASVSFTVPRVPTGKYHLIYCNEPCTVNGIGDLVGGEAFYVAPTYEEAALLARLERLEWRLAQARQNVRQERRTAEAFEHRLDVQAHDLAEAEVRVATLEAQLAEIRASAGRQETPRAPLAPGWALTVAAAFVAAGAIATAALVRRKRTPEFVVPDTIPDDLETREPALRT